MKLAVIALVVVACGSRAETSPAPPAPPPVAVSPMPASARQLIVGITDDWASTHVTLQRYDRADHGWKPIGEPWQGVVGASGLAWGNGLHGNGAPRDRSGPTKQEGDGKSPAGMFQLRGAYGYAKRAPKGTALAYTQTTPSWQCVDDVHSKHYTQIVDRGATTVDWKSAEQMRRKDELYTWVIDIAHNPGAVAGGGSCIFFHVWRGPDSVTVGCTAMPEPTLAKLLATLDPTAVYVLLPRAEYAALAGAWELPAAK